MWRMNHAILKRGGVFMKKTRTIIFLGLFIAINIVLVRMLSLNPLPSIRIDFGFLPIALSSVMFGPVLGGITGAAADLLGYPIAPTGPYFPGFTLSGFVSGAMYGLVLYKKPNTLVRVVIAAVLSIVLVDLVLNTAWLSILYNKGVLAILPLRLLKAAIMLPVQVSVIYVLRRTLRVYLEKSA
jgi:ECF transporter S component (folate family)